MLPACPGHCFHRIPPSSICSRRLLGALLHAGPPAAALPYCNTFHSITPKICIHKTCVVGIRFPAANASVEGFEDVKLHIGAEHHFWY